MSPSYRQCGFPSSSSFGHVEDSILRSFINPEYLQTDNDIEVDALQAPMPSIDSSVWLGQPANGAEHDIGMPPQGYISGSVSSSCPDPASLQLVQSSDRFCPPVDQRWALPESLHDEGILQDLIHNERILSQIQEQSESETLHVFDRLLVDADRTAIVYDDRCGLSDPLQFRKIGVNFLSIPRSPNFLPNLDFCLSLENSKHSIDIQPLPQSNSQSSDTQDILRSLSEPAHPGSKAVNSELAVSSSALRSSTTNPKSILPRPTESQHSGTDSQSLLHISQGRNASKLSMAKSLKQGRKVIKGVPAQNCFTWSLHSNQKNVMKNRIERQKSNATSNTGCLRCQQHRIKCPGDYPCKPCAEFFKRAKAVKHVGIRSSWTLPCFDTDLNKLDVFEYAACLEAVQVEGIDLISPVQRFDQHIGLKAYMYQLNNCSLMLHKLNTIMSQGLDHRTGIEESVMLRNLMESIAEPLATWGHKFLQECQPMRKHLTGFLEHHLERLDGSTYSVEKTRRQCLECKGNKFAHTIFSRTVFDRIHTLSPDLMSKIHDNLKTWWDIYRCTFGVRETLIYLPVDKSTQQTIERRELSRTQISQEVAKFFRDWRLHTIQPDNNFQLTRPIQQPNAKHIIWEETLI